MALNPTNTFGETQTSPAHVTAAGLRGPHKPGNQTVALQHFILNSPWARHQPTYQGQITIYVEWVGKSVEFIYFTAYTLLDKNENSLARGKKLYSLARFSDSMKMQSGAINKGNWARLLNPAIALSQNINHCYWYNFTSHRSFWRTNSIPIEATPFPQINSTSTPQTSYPLLHNQAKSGVRWRRIPANSRWHPKATRDPKNKSPKIQA